MDPASDTPPTTPPATPAPSAFNADGSFGENWISSLGEEFAPHADMLSSFKDVKGLAKSYAHFRRTGPSYPGEDSTPEDIDRFRDMAKVPKNVEGYAITKPETLPEGVTWDDDLAAKVAKVAHDHHVPAPALQAIINTQLESMAAGAQANADAFAAAEKEAQEELVSAWRGDFEQNTNIVNQMAKAFGDEAGIPADDPTLAGLVKIPQFAKMMLAVSKRTSEDGVRPPAGFGDLRSGEQRLNEIMTGKDPIWGEKYLNGDREAMEMVSKMMDDQSTGSATGG